MSVSSVSQEEIRRKCQHTFLITLPPALSQSNKHLPRIHLPVHASVPGQNVHLGFSMLGKKRKRVEVETKMRGRHKLEEVKGEETGH